MAEPSNDVSSESELRRHDELGVSRAMLSAFPTPLINYRWTNVAPLNDALRAAILGVAAKGMVGRRGVAGWQSTPDFFNWDVACVRDLRGRLQRFVVELTKLVLAPSAENQKIRFQLSGSAEVMQRTQYGHPRSHPKFFWSGIYHLTDNEASDEHPMSGKLELLDPRPGAALAAHEPTNLYGRFFVNPSAGQMVMFPSWLQYYVHPYFGSSDRVSIVFNVGLEVSSESREPQR